ncbi:MAG: hypothetical protein Q7U85_05320 [Rhodocyclaceae bacterium]|nr:hypothetical protein [Rhodocyclaceae bacterium]
MTQSAHYLRTVLLACLLMTGALCAVAEEPATAGQARQNVSRTTPVDPDDALRSWFKEQDRLLDDILLRLSRIETLVRDIHRLVQQLQAPAEPPAATPVVAPAATTVAPAALPAATSPAMPPEWLDLLDNQAIPLAGGGLLLLILLIWSRRRKAARLGVSPPGEVKPAPPPAAPPPAAPATSPVAALEPSPTPSPPHPAQFPTMPHTATAGSSGAGKSQEQALELAEIMLAMGLGQGAAQTLTEQIHKEPKQGLRNWLKLLEIYRETGQQDEFERSAEELRQHFNVLPEDWQVQPEAPRSIESYPHIAARLTELWGKPACAAYLGNLLDDNRDGVRTGFPQSVAEDLLLLVAIMEESTPAPLRPPLGGF